MSKQSAKTCLAAAGVLLLVGCLGCGTGGYEQRLEETVKRLGQESSFSAMYPPVQLPDTAVTVQLPQFFDQSPLPGDTDDRRLKPPWVEVPELKFTHEGSVTDSKGGSIPFYCYLAASKTDPQGTLRRQLQTAFPNTDVKWEPVDCKMLSGETSRWQRLHGGGGEEQEFYCVNKEGQGQFAKMPGTMEFYLRQVGGVFVLIGWRLPTGIEKLIGQGNDFGLDVWAPMVAGSVPVEE